jgi:hypothetical protein
MKSKLILMAASRPRSAAAIGTIPTPNPDIRT